MRFSHYSSLFGLVLLVETAGAHSRWKLDGPTPPRTTDTGLKQPQGQVTPCGGAARTTKPRQFKPASKLTLQWEETIDHQGNFSVRFSQANDQFNTVLIDKMVDDKNGVSGSIFQAEITLPNVKCDACTLQLEQVMTGSTLTYVSCADIQLVDNPAPPPAPTMPPAKDVPAKPMNLKVRKL